MTLIRRLRTALVITTVVVAPATGSVLAAPATAPVLPPAGAAAWQADRRQLPDPVTATPSEVRAWFAAMPAARQAALAAEHPGVVGNLDGAPIALRYAANRRSLQESGVDHPDGDYLIFDPRGRGRVAQVFGDLSTALRVAVIVPGMRNRLANFWRGVGGQAYRSPAVQAADLQRAGSGPGGLAVIAWLGYDAPQGFDEAGRPHLSQSGATALTRFVDGLAAVRPDATIALLGHSYGSTVIGHAAPRLSPRVTDLAVFGSPGMGVDSAAALRTGARVWAGQSTGDFVAWVPPGRLFGMGHGAKPVDPGFGARLFPTADVSDHDHYLSPGTDSFTALAGIAGGRR